MLLLFTFMCSLVLLLPSRGQCLLQKKFSKGHYTLPRLLDATVTELQYGLDRGLFSSVDLVNAYIARIDEVNAALNVVTEVNPDALEIAAQLDAERVSGNNRGPLHGIPMLIKNNIATADKMNTTAGSYALLGATMSRDSTVVTKLRAAGVVILGKSNMSQWANFRSSNSSNGWSAHGGQVYAAYHRLQDPSGSSSGSGVGTSIGLAVAALGTETSGSILAPSGVNNIVGIKPSVGLTSRSLVIPVSPHQDTVGPMARTVRDAALILSAIAGPDPSDNYTSKFPFKQTPMYASFLCRSALRGARIGIPQNVINFSFNNATTPPLLRAFDRALAVLRSAGATIVDNANFTAYEQYMTYNSTIVFSDFVSALAVYLSKLKSNPKNITNLASLRSFTQSFEQEDYPDRNTAIWDIALSLGFDSDSHEAQQAYEYAQYLGGEGGVLGALERHNLSAVVLPTQFSWAIPALVGSPVVSVPMGAYDDADEVWDDRGNLVQVGENVPFGLSFLGQRFDEARLIGYAYAYEQRTHWRRRVKPLAEMVPKTEISDVISSQV